MNVKAIASAILQDTELKNSDAATVLLSMYVLLLVTHF